MFCVSSFSAAVLQSGARWFGVGLGAGVGGRIEAMASGLEVKVRFLERESLFCLRPVCPVEDVAMSVSLSILQHFSGSSWPPRLFVVLQRRVQFPYC
jgi:hypothetical protein